jgi:uncharacterized membrane protein YgcG
MKSIIIIVFSLFALQTMAFNSQYKVIDKENVLSGTQKSLLNQSFVKFSKKHDVDIYTIVANHLVGKSLEQYAIEVLQESMHERFTNKLWVAIAVSPSNRQWKIMTHPKLSETFTSTLLKNIEQQSLKPTIAKINYVEGVIQSIKTIDNILNGTLSPSDIRVKHTYSWLFLIAIILLGLGLIFYIWLGKYFLTSFSNLNFMIGNTSYEDFTMSKGIYQSNSASIKGGAIVVGHW